MRKKHKKNKSAGVLCRGEGFINDFGELAYFILFGGVLIQHQHCVPYSFIRGGTPPSYKLVYKPH